MKKTVFVLMAFLAFNLTQLRAQTAPYTDVVLNFSDADGSVLTEYYIDAYKQLHWRISVTANHPYAYDGNPDDNMVGFLLQSGQIYYYAPTYFNATTFPNGADYYTGTVDLSGLTNQQIRDCTIDTYFWFRVNDENGDFDHYADFNYGTYLQPVNY